MIRIAAIIILVYLLFQSNKKQDDEINTLKASIVKLQAKNKQKEYKSTFGELESIQPKHRAMVVAIAMSESNCNYNVKHPDTQTKGIGGIKEDLWSLKYDANSLKAIEEIIITLEKRGKTPYEIIRYYKGAKTNLKSTAQCWDLYKRLKGIL